MELKPFFSYKQQIEELRSKGIVIDHDECLTILRNKCAHYSRLYYAVFTSVPLFDEGFDSTIARTLYPQLLMMKQLVQNNDVWMEFAESFALLIDEYNEAVVLEHMGLPDDWKAILY